MRMLQKNIDGETPDPDSAAFYDQRRMWIELVLEHPEVGHAAARIGVWLARRMNGRDCCCWWSVGKIAEKLNASTKTVSQATAELERLGLLRVVRSKGRGNTYFIRAPFM